MSDEALPGLVPLLGSLLIQVPTNSDGRGISSPILASTRGLGIGGLGSILSPTIGRFREVYSIVEVSIFVLESRFNSLRSPSPALNSPFLIKLASLFSLESWNNLYDIIPGALSNTIILPSV